MDSESSVPRKRKRRKACKRYINRRDAKCEGYIYDESKRIWLRKVRDGRFWCMDCGEWKALEEFSKMFENLIATVKRVDVYKRLCLHTI